MDVFCLWDWSDAAALHGKSSWQSKVIHAMAARRKGGLCLYRWSPSVLFYLGIELTLPTHIQYVPPSSVDYFWKCSHTQMKYVADPLSICQSN